MAFRLATLKRVGSGSGYLSDLTRWINTAALPPPVADIVGRVATSQQFILPEVEQIPDRNSGNNVGYGFPSFSAGGSMELMCVPRKKVTPHKRGIRNGPKALKPTPVIIHLEIGGRLVSKVAHPGNIAVIA